MPKPTEREPLTFDPEKWRTMHRDYKGRMADGRRCHMALEPITGDTVLLVEKDWRLPGGGHY